MYIGCLTLPAFVLNNNQDGIARSHDWMRLGLMPQFVIRQGLIIGFTAGALALGFHLSATVAMLASAGAVWIAMSGQMIVLNRKLARHIEPGPKAHDFRGWLAISLPILLVESYSQTQFSAHLPVHPLDLAHDWPSAKLRHDRGKMLDVDDLDIDDQNPKIR